MSSAATTKRRLVVSRGWRWKFLWRADPEAYRLCLFGLLVEWIRSDLEARVARLEKWAEDTARWSDAVVERIEGR